MNYLTRRGRVDRRRLEAQGFGPQRPLNPNAQTEDEHAANRRVEFVIIQTQ
jgi:flagellar motor protein MotB